MTQAELAMAWNRGADHMNSWAELGTDEKVEFAFARGKSDAQALLAAERERWRLALVAKADAVAAANTSRRGLNSAAAWVREVLQEMADELGAPNCDVEPSTTASLT